MTRKRWEIDKICGGSQSTQQLDGHQQKHMTADFERIFAFTIELDRLKAILRKTKPVGLNRYENTAEHSWQVCLLALALKSTQYRRLILFGSSNCCWFTTSSEYYR